MLVTIRKSQVKDGAFYYMKATDDVLVAKSARIQAMTGNVIEGGAANQSVTVAGTIYGGNPGAGVVLSGAKAVVTVTASGTIATPGAVGVYFSGANPKLVNDGLIVGWYGVHTDPGFSGTFNLVNRGTIIGSNDAVWSSTELGEKTVLKNSGFIRGDMINNDGKSYVGGAGVDVVINTGKMQGQIQLQSGNDVYDGTKGFIFWGNIYAGEGNDRIAPGLSRETVLGDLGTDTLDFRKAGAVTVDFLDAAANKGLAKGDIYTGFEAILGSAKADVLLGDDVAMVFNGGAGVDRIDGRGGNDTLNGGAGRDKLTGGLGNDVFVFAKPTEGGDQISDFTSGSDKLQLSAKGFGGGLVAGALDPARLAIGTTGQAVDRNDRFIFDTDDGKLWFDKDGSAGRFKPVLIADLQDGATLTASDFLLA